MVSEKVTELETMRYLVFKSKDIQHHLTIEEKMQLDHIALKLNAARRYNGRKPLDGMFVAKGTLEYDVAKAILLERINRENENGDV